MRPPHLLETISLHTAFNELRVYGVITIDLRGMVQSWNKGAFDLLGFTEEEALGQDIRFIFVPEDKDLGIPEQEMQTALSQGYAYDDRWHLRGDGTRVYVNGTLCFLKNEKGEALGFVKIFRDQTEKRERAEHIENLNFKLREAHEALHDYAGELEEKVAARTQQLTERNTELETFCYSIAHDIRAPLRSIQAMSQVVVEDYGPALDPTCRDYLDRIARAGNRLDQLTLDLLKYSRLAREDIDLEVVEVEEALAEVMTSFQETILGREAEIEVRRPLPAVRAQYSYLVQILANFLSNALKFTEEGVNPKIEIWAEKRNDRVRISVRDNGIGIPDEYRQKIFHLFERLHHEKSFEGTGVGLAIAQKAASRMKGTVGLDSDAATGSTFWLELDQAESPDSGEPPTSA